MQQCIVLKKHMVLVYNDYIETTKQFWAACKDTTRFEMELVNHVIKHYPTHEENGDHETKAAEEDKNLNDGRPNAQEDEILPSHLVWCKYSFVFILTDDRVYPHGRP